MKTGIFCFVLLLGLDIISKFLAPHLIPPIGSFDLSYPFGGVPVFHLFGISFSLNYVVNTGAAWGLFKGHAGLLFILRTLIIFGLSACLFTKKIPPLFSYWLILTGAIGNTIDYLLYGHVIDYLHFTFWGHSFPIFNLADSYITLGVLGLFFFQQAQLSTRPQ